MANIEYLTGGEEGCPPHWPDLEPHEFLLALDEDELEDWYQKAHMKVSVGISAPVVLPIAAEETDVAEEFAALVSEWKEATWPISLAKRRIVHPAYLKIIGMGPVAIRLLLNELKREPDLWHYALESITRQNPVPEGSDMKGVREAWLQWGVRRGYCDPR